MLKRDVTYENFDGETVTDTLYFNLTRTELVELQVDYEGGLDTVIERIVEAKDVKSIFSLFKRILVAAYGVKSDDGKRFIKNEQLREEFTQTAAYDALITEISTDDNKASAFIIGVIPKGMADDVNQQKLPLEAVGDPTN